MNIILVVGAPRSGTTYLANEISKRLNIALLPEAQFIIDAVKKRPLSIYTKKYWNIFNNNSVKIANIDLVSLLQQELQFLNCPSQINFVEHTPQNIIFLDEIISFMQNQNINVYKIIAPLRKPSLSINSLANQEWFKGGIIKAALFNFRCMWALYKNRNIVEFFDINDPKLHKKLDISFGTQTDTHRHINFISKHADLKTSHSYFLNYRYGNSSSYFNKFLSIPSIILHTILLKKLGI